MYRVDFAMIEAGGGHKSPAVAVNEALQRNYPGKYETKVLDFMKDLGCVKMDAAHKRFWNFLLQHPFLAFAGFNLMNIYPALSRRLVINSLKRFYPYVENYLEKEKPDLIFSTHYFNSFALGKIIKEKKLPTRLVTFVSELFDVHALWIIDSVDDFIVSTRYARRLLIHNGIRPEVVKVFPYPIRNSFFEIKRSRQEILLELGLDLEKKTLLISFGGQGIGKIHYFLDALCTERLSLNVIAVTGKNMAAYHKLSSQYTGRRDGLTIAIIGYAQNMNELLFACDFCFIKSGPATTMEAVLLKKPIIFYQAASGNEKTNILYFLKKKVAFYAGQDVACFLSAVKNYLNPFFYQMVMENYNRLNLRNGADEIAEFINNLFSN